MTIPKILGYHPIWRCIYIYIAYEAYKYIVYIYNVCPNKSPELSHLISRFTSPWPFYHRASPTPPSRWPRQPPQSAPAGLPGHHFDVFWCLMFQDHPASQCFCWCILIIFPNKCSMFSTCTIFCSCASRICHGSWHVCHYMNTLWDPAGPPGWVSGLNTRLGLRCLMVRTNICIARFS